MVRANGSEGVRAVHRDHVRAAFKKGYRAKHPNASEDTLRQAFNRALKKGVIGIVEGDYIKPMEVPF